MIAIKDGPKVNIERVSGKIEIATIIRLYHSENFKGYGIRLEDGTEIPIGRDQVTFMEKK